MAQRVLVAYGTKYRATAEIAELIGKTLGDAGLDVDVRRARKVRDVGDYGVVVLGSAVYMGRWRADALRLLKRRRRDLSERDVWLFSSGPVGEEKVAPSEAERAKTESWTKPKRVQALAAEIGVRDHAVFGGSVSPDGGFLRKKMAQATPEEFRDRRDWDEIRTWAEGIAAAVGGDFGAGPSSADVHL